MKKIHFAMFSMALLMGWSCSGSDDTPGTKPETPKPPVVTPTVQGVYTLNADTTEVKTEDYTISFDATVIDEPTELKVSTVTGLPPAINDSRNVTVVDVQLGDLKELTGTVDIRLPLTVGAGEMACAAYYNENTKEWEPVEHYYDEKTHEMVIQSHHLSIFSAFSVTDQWKRTARLTFEYCIPLPIAQWLAVHEQMREFAKSDDPDATAVDYFTSDYCNLSTFGIDIGYNMVKAAGFESPFLENYGDVLTHVGVMIGTWQLMRAKYYEHNDVKAACIGMKTWLNWVGGKVTSFFGTAAMYAAMASVSFIDYSLTKFAERSVEMRKDLYQAAFNLYHQKGRPGYRSAVDWYKVLYPLFKRTDVTEEELKQLIDKEVTDWCNKFWVDEIVVAEYLSEATNITSTAGGGLNQGIKDEISQGMRGDLYSGILIPVFNSIENHLRSETYDKMVDEMEKYTKMMNQGVRLALVDSTATGGKSKFAGYTVKFKELPDSIKDSDEWQAVLDEKGEGKIDFRVYAVTSAEVKPVLVVVSPKGEIVNEVKFTMMPGKNNINIGKVIPDGAFTHPYEGNEQIDWQVKQWTFPYESVLSYEYWVLGDDGYRPMSFKRNGNIHLIYDGSMGDDHDWVYKRFYQSIVNIPVDKNGNISLDKDGMKMTGTVDFDKAKEGGKSRTVIGEGTFSWNVSRTVEPCPYKAYVDSIHANPRGWIERSVQVDRTTTISMTGKFTIKDESDRDDSYAHPELPYVIRFKFDEGTVTANVKYVSEVSGYKRKEVSVGSGRTDYVYDLSNLKIKIDTLDVNTPVTYFDKPVYFKYE